MPGTRAQAKNVVDNVCGYSNAAVTAAQILNEYVSTVYGRLTGIKFLAVTAGSGAGNTVGDVLKNGTSIWATAANRPTLAAASTGEFNNAIGDAGSVAIKPGDRITLQINTIPATTGHARVAATASIEGNA
ncbi:MAG TPA: hypothetical protein VKB37_15190 [Jatrophihabitantaceae bacterium]|nr:hypothetical protein [Jatrophihabitantaceae bacterium]